MASDSSSSADSSTAPGPQHTSLSLLQQVQARDQKAWWRLVYLYGPVIEHWCRRWKMKPEDTADVCQEVFQVIAQRVGDFHRDRAGDSFRGWIWAITRYKIADHFRKLPRNPVTGVDLANLEDLPERPPVEEDSTSENALLQRALHLIRAEFEERTWQMFWRTTVDGHEVAAVAADMEITPNGVRLARSRIQRRLREVLSDMEEV